MQPFTQKWTLVAFVEPVRADTVFSWKQWPLHITLADVFKTEYSDTELSERIAEDLKSCQPFELVAKTDTHWGEHQEHHVMLFEKSSEILVLHERLLEGLAGFGAVFNEPGYVGTGYVPHIAMKQDKPLKPGDLVKVTSVSLIDMFPGGDGYLRRVVRSIELHA